MYFVLKQIRRSTFIYVDYDLLGHPVVQLNEALRYNPENVAGSILEGSMKFSIDINLPAALWSWDRFLLGEGGRCLQLTSEIFWGPQTPGDLRACPDLYRGSFTGYY